MQAKAYLIDGRKSAFTELICAPDTKIGSAFQPGRADPDRLRAEYP